MQLKGYCLIIQGMWFDTPTAMMLPGMDDSSLNKFLKNDIGELPRLVHALSRNFSKTEKILVDAGGKELTREWIQVRVSG